MRISQLINRIDIQLIQGDLELEIREIRIDQRRIEHGDLFVAIRGTAFDAHTVLGDAIDRGAAALLIQDSSLLPPNLAPEITVLQCEDTRAALAELACAFYDYPVEKMYSIAVTGSKGKSTVTGLIYNMLQLNHIPAIAIGTRGIFRPDQYKQLKITTPDALTLNRELSAAFEAGCRVAVIEASSQAFLQHRIGGMHFNLSLFLNIEPGDHIGPAEHKDFDDYFRCKAGIATMGKIALINTDCPYYERLCQTLGDHPHLDFGRKATADYRIVSEEAGETELGLGMYFKTQGRLNADLVIPMPGDFSVSNGMAAAAALNEYGLKREEIASSLRQSQISGRLEMIYRSERLSLCVDFAHNGFALRNLLKALRLYRPKRLVVIFGGGGNRDPERRVGMGQACAELADFSYVTTSHSRLERFEVIVSDILKGLDAGGGKYRIIEDRKEAIRTAITDSEFGDLIAMVTLGDEDYINIGGRYVPHSDKDFALQVLEELRQSGRFS